MRKTSFLKADWFSGLLVALLFLFSAHTDIIQSLERKAYDWGVLASSRLPSDKIAVIAIDDVSIANLGRWPWPREIQGKMLEILAEGHAKVIGHTALFFEPQVDAGLDYILNIAAVLEKTTLQQTNPAEWQELQGLLQDALLHLDNDQKLAESMAKVNNVLLGLYFELGEPQGKPDAPLPDYVLKNNLVNVQGGSDASFPIPAINALVPIPVLGQRAIAIGHLNATPDVDGGAHRALGGGLLRPILSVLVADDRCKKFES